MKFKILWVFHLLIINMTFANEGHKQIDLKVKSRLEDLLIWKISDELKLPPTEEQKLSEIIKDINKRKIESTKNIDDLTKKLAQSSTDKERNKIYKDLKSAMKLHGNIPIEELDQIKLALGLKKLSKYLELKQDIAEKVKNIIIPQKNGERKKLPPPKIIEE